MNDGWGSPVNPVGLIVSSFRPSDDATLFGFLVPSNLFAITSLRQVAEILRAVRNNTDLAGRCEALAGEVEEAVKKYAIVEHPEFGKVYAFEVDGYGSRVFMDDANVPSLLALPFLGCVDVNDPIYQNTRRLVLSPSNPYFFKGKAGEGIGGPHIGFNYIWPMSLIMRATTSNDEKEIRYCIETLRDTDGGTGFMHESFHKDNPSDYTRSWFAWTNTLFGELIVKLQSEGQAERPPRLISPRLISSIVETGCAPSHPHINLDGIHENKSTIHLDRSGGDSLHLLWPKREFVRTARQAHEHPYIMTDDHSFQTISAYDKRYIQTPNIDRIANEGVRFTNSFVANSISGPSRACMLTGKHSHKNGFIDNAHTFDGSQQTFPKLLRKAGYQTAMIGKWHLTSDPTGFDYWNILVGQGDYYNPIFIDNGEKRQIEGYATNITTDLALDWLAINRDKSKPFCSCCTIRLRTVLGCPIPATCVFTTM